jgi:hypothetical protein
VPEDHIVSDPWFAIKTDDKATLVKRSPFGHEQAVLLRYKGYRKLIEWKRHELEILNLWRRTEYHEWDVPQGERWPLPHNRLMDQVESLHENAPRAQGIEIPSGDWPEHILDTDYDFETDHIHTH